MGNRDVGIAVQANGNGAGSEGLLLVGSRMEARAFTVVPPLKEEDDCA